MNALPAGLLLFDSSIYIPYSRGQKYGWLGNDVKVFQRTILSSVVAAELYAGTRESREKRALDELCRAHAALGHLSTPYSGMWIEVGILLRRARKSLGQGEFAHHFRDALIALEAVYGGATLVTQNIRHFARWQSLLTSARKRLNLFDGSQMP